MCSIDHNKWAKIFLVALIEHIRNFQGGDKYLTYGKLAKQVGYPEPHTGNIFGKNIGETLDVMGHMFDDIVVDGENIPLIPSLVVNQSKKIPSDGLKEFNSNYPSLSDEKKRDFVSSEYKKIFEFGNRWEKVLTILGINQSKNLSDFEHAKKSNLYNPYGSEGSPEHIALREFVANNPSVIGLDCDARGITEYPLKSGDIVDVVFETSEAVVGVEVKSKRSGTDDIERGLYQCIKYLAVLEAEKKVNDKTADISCILVMEGILAHKLSKIQRCLGIKVCQNISPNA